MGRNSGVPILTINTLHKKIKAQTGTNFFEV